MRCPIRSLTRRTCLGSFLALGLLAVSSCTLLRSTGRPVCLRVLTYNIHHGEGADGVFDLERLARVITAADPDLVALQEVDRATERSSGLDQAAELGRLTGMRAFFGEAMPYQGGGYGEAILTRLSVVRVVTHPLPAGPAHEPRAALAVTVRAGPAGPRVVFIGTHLDHTSDSTDRIAQAEQINTLAAGYDPLPQLLAGDLNAVPESEPMLMLARYWQDTSTGRPEPTFPSLEPARRLDYVLTRGGTWRVVEVRVLDEEVASDHRPLLVVLETGGRR